MNVDVGTSSFGTPSNNENVSNGSATKRKKQKKGSNTDIAGSIVHDALYIDAHMGTSTFGTLCYPEIASKRPDIKRIKQEDSSNTNILESHVYEALSGDAHVGCFRTVSDTEITSNCLETKPLKPQESSNTKNAESRVHKAPTLNVDVSTVSFGTLTNREITSKHSDIKRPRQQESFNTIIAESHNHDARYTNSDLEIGSPGTLSKSPWAIQPGQQECSSTDAVGSFVHEALCVDAQKWTGSIGTVSNPEMASRCPETKRLSPQKSLNMIIVGSNVHEAVYTDADVGTGSFGTLSNAKIASKCPDNTQPKRQESFNLHTAGSLVHGAPHMNNDGSNEPLSSFQKVSKSCEILGSITYEFSNRDNTGSLVHEAHNRDVGCPDCSFSRGDIKENISDTHLQQMQELRHQRGTDVRPTKAIESACRPWSQRYQNDFDFNTINNVHEHQPSVSKKHKEFEIKINPAIKFHEWNSMQDVVTMEIVNPELEIYEHVKKDYHNLADNVQCGDILTDQLDIKKNSGDDHCIPETSCSDDDTCPQTDPRAGKCTDVEKHLTTAPKKKASDLVQLVS